MTASEPSLEHILRNDGRTPEERRQLARLVLSLAALPPPPDPHHSFTDYASLREELLRRLEGEDGDALEEAFLALYCHLHMQQAPYTTAERELVDQTGGYWCHPGGLSPLLRAAPWVGPDTVSADLGAGNGLQGLLLQLLYPHRRTVLVEISERMVEIGRRLQGWLGVPEGKVEWVRDDVRNVSVRGVDFLYLYRPLRPGGPGDAFYRGVAAELAEASHQVVVFSVADCLGEHLSPCFERFSFDGHLACFRGPLEKPTGLGYAAR